MIALLKLLLTNMDAVFTLALACIAILKLTAWGRANAEALHVVVEAVETVQQTDVKQEVARQHPSLSEMAQDALTDAVQMADEKKTPLPALLRVCREAFRGLFPVR